MSIEQNPAQTKAVPGVAVTIPDNYHFSPTATYTDARCRIQFSQKTSGCKQYPRSFRFTNKDGVNDVWAMFNSSRATAAVDATYQVGTTTNGVLLKWTSDTAKSDAPAIVLVNPGTASATLSVTINASNLITASLATDALGAITTIPSELAAAITALDKDELSVTTTTGTSALAAAATASFTGGVDKDSPTARQTAISGQVSADSLSTTQVFAILPQDERVFTLGEDVQDVLIYAVTASQSEVYIEVAYESELRT